MLIGVAVQPFQLFIVAYIKRGESVVVTGQIDQRGIVAYIERGELVGVAVQRRQRGVIAYIKRGELVGIAQYSFVNALFLLTSSVVSWLP